MQTGVMEAMRLGATTEGATAHRLPPLLVAMTAVTMTDMHAGPHPCEMPTEHSFMWPEQHQTGQTP